MPTLPNPRQERFCQEVASGKSANEAYRLAGYTPSRFHASRLATKGNIVARIAELIAEAASKAEIDIERALRELGRLSFVDIRGAVRWKRKVVETVTDEKGTERQEIQDLVLLDSDQIPDDVAACIQEVWQDKEGRIRIKLYNKQAALQTLVAQLERGKGADLAVPTKQEPQEPAYSGPGVVDAREAFRRYLPRDRS